MIENLLVRDVWFALVIGVISYAVGHLLVFYEAYLYNIGAKNYIQLSGKYDLVTNFQNVTARQQIVNIKFPVTLAVLSIGIWFMWQLLIQQSNRPDIFVFLMGGLLLRIAVASIQSTRNIMLFRHAQRTESLRGNIEYSRRLVHTLAFIELYSFAALYFLLFLMSASLFLLGGAIVCFINGLQRSHWTVAYT